MADNRTTTTGRPTDEPESVLGSLPATRPERFGRPRREVRAASVQGRGPRPAKAARAKKVASPRRAPAAKQPATHKPAAVSAGCPELERPHAPSPPPPRPIGHPTGTALVTTAIQATGELARIGLTVGGQVLKRAADRLPRP
jgi:hypothetical protein